MVSSDRLCNLDSDLIVDDQLSLSYCNASSLDLNTHSTINDLYASVDSPCISSKTCLDESLYDMLASSCCHDKNACVPSNSCMNDNVEETQFAMQQDMNLSSSKINYSSSSTHHCLMAKSSSSNDNNNDNNDEEDDEENNDALLHDKGLVILKALSKNKNACNNLYEIMSALVERRETIEALEANLEEKGRIEREDANEKASLEDALEEEHETRVSLEEKIESIEESHNAILPCASPISSSTRNVGTSCDELLALPCCSNNDAYTSSSTSVVTNHGIGRAHV